MAISVAAISVDLAEIDALIAQYTNAERRIGVNLHAVGTDPMYALVESAALRGESGRRSRAVAARSDRLWPLYLGLQRTLEQIRTLRGSKRRLSSQNCAEVEALLTEKSVIADDEPEPMTIEQTLQTLRAIYEPLAEAVAHINDVLTTALPRLGAYDESLRRWESQADVLGMQSAALVEARQRVDELRQRATDDPLSVKEDDLDALAKAVTAAGEQVAEAGSARDTLQRDLATMVGVVSELRELRTQAAAAYQDATNLIVAPIGLVQVPAQAAIDGPEGIQARLDAITAGPDDWQTIRSALDAWTEHSGRLRDQLERARARNSIPLQYRSELRGRLSAFRAKLEAVGSSDGVAIDLADEIHNELYTAPTDLGRADRMLNELTLRLARKEPS